MYNINSNTGGATKGARLITTMQEFQQNYEEYRGKLKKGGSVKEIQTIDFGANIAISIKVLKNGEVEIVNVIDKEIAPVVGEFGIRQETSRPAARITTSLFFENNGVIHTTVSRLALMCNCSKVTEDVDVHHKKHMRINLISELEVMSKEKHGRTSGAELKTDKEVRAYVYKDLLNVNEDRFEELLDDLRTLSRVYPKSSGIYLSEVSLLDTRLSEIIEDLDNYVTLSRR